MEGESRSRLFAYLPRDLFLFRNTILDHTISVSRNPTALSLGNSRLSGVSVGSQLIYFYMFWDATLYHTMRMSRNSTALSVGNQDFFVVTVESL